MKKYRSPSLPWAIVFVSAVLTLASATARPKAPSARPLRPGSSPAGTEPGCGPSCPRRTLPSPDAPVRRELWMLADGCASVGEGERS